MDLEGLVLSHTNKNLFTAHKADLLSVVTINSLNLCNNLLLSS